ncbi:Lipoprotein LipO precursor [compost metagenome]
MKKQSSVLLSVVTSIALLAGCSSSEQGNADAGQTNNSTSKTIEKKTFSMLVESNPSWPYNKDWPVWKWIEEKTGVTFNISVPSGKLDEAVKLNVASGNMPDISMMLSLAEANKYGQQGALVNILDYKDEMPNFKKWMEKYPEITKGNIASDGKMYMFPNEGFGETNRMNWLYREDIFKKHGLAKPTNYDELYTVLKKLKELYPDSYPLSFRMGKVLHDSMTKILTPAFGTNELYVYDDAAKQVKYGPVEDGYKSMVEYLSKFAKEKLIPPNWLTVDTKQWQDLMSTNKAFVTFDYIGRIDFFNQPLRKDNPEYTLAFMAPPAGPGGKQLNPYTQILQSGMTISSDSKQIKAIMKYIDFYYTEEARTLVSWGKEGETYTVENGVKKIKPEYTDLTDLRKKTGLASHGTYNWIDFDAHLSLASTELKAAYEEARKYDSAYHPIAAFNDKEQEILSTVGEAINKHREENISKFITGDKSLDGWAKYVEEANKLGLPQIMDIYKTAYERAKNAK